jgi:hypothetical protein
MSATTYICLAYLAVTVGLGGYLLWMLRNNVRLCRRKQQMELLSDD